MELITFWNGNKSPPRQGYETDLLRTCLDATQDKFSTVTLMVDNSDYPRAEDESDIFQKGADVLVTVAGNRKFATRDKIMIPRPLTKGLLGYRLIIARNDNLPRFGKLVSDQELQELAIGIPNTWADAEMFRHNNYRVVEKGEHSDLFTRLRNREFDYTALGVNEVEAALEEQAVPVGEISIEPSTMIYYPMPLVFYVNPAKPPLAQRIETGLGAIMDNGEFDKLFARYHGDVVERLGLKQRKIFTLQNPFLPPEMADFRPTLLD